MKITIVGIGKMGTTYVRNLIALGFQLSDILAVDIDPSKVEAARKDFAGLTVENDLSVLPVTEVAIVATNTPSHARVIEELCGRGTRDIFCEKPLGMSRAQIDQIEVAVSKANGQVFTGFLINFSPAAHAIIELMKSEDLVCADGIVLWGKNRIGDTRPSAGDTEDESVHGAELLRMLAGINRAILAETVSARLSYLPFVDPAAQAAAHALDPSFPLEVDSSTHATVQMRTDTGPVNLTLYSSFLLGEQVRTVRFLLTDRDDPTRARYGVRIDFDEKQGADTVDIMQMTDMQARKDLGTRLLPTNKIRDQLAAFLQVVGGGAVDPRLTPFWRAAAATRFTEAIKESHQNDGAPTESLSDADLRLAA